MRAIVQIMVVALAGGACTPEVVITGDLSGSRDDKSMIWPGALVNVHDLDGVLYNSVRSNSQGRFRVRAPRGQTVFIEVSDSAHPAASFTGTSGFESPLEINLGDPPDVYGVEQEELDAIHALFEGCPGLGDGALVVGQAFAVDILDAAGEHPSMATVTATVLPIDGDPIFGCYLNEEGTAYSEDADLTGGSGTFAVAGVPPGLHSLVVENHLPTGLTSQTATTILVGEAAIVPRFPFLMESGLLF